jgi:hypothetical protein
VTAVAVVGDGIIHFGGLFAIDLKIVGYVMLD